MRQSRSEPGGHQVYLLDTMNNVLGILILALILTRLIFPHMEDDKGIGKDVIAALKKKLATVVMPQNPDAIDASSVANRERELKDLGNRLSAAGSKKEEATAIRARLERERADLISKVTDLLPGGDSTKTKADVEEAISRMDDARAKLRESLRQAAADYEAAARSAQVGADKVVDVSVPAAEGGVTVESAPRDAKVVVFICFKGRVIPMDSKAVNDALVEGLKAVIKDKGKETTVQDLTSYFKEHDVGDPSIRVELIPIRDREGPTCLARLNPRAKVGEDLLAIRSGRSEFEKKLRELDREKGCVIFQVWSDSFESYLAARRIADSIGVSCGWTPFASDQHLQFRLFRDRTDPGTGPEIDVRRK